MHSPAVRLRAIELIGQGWSQAAVSRELNISKAAVREWLRTGGAFKVRGGSAVCFRCNPEAPCDEAAYAYLLGLYLGDGCISKAANKDVYALRIACCDAWPGLMDMCEQAMRTVMANKVCRVRMQGCHSLVSYSKHWPCLFPQHGPGRKHERTIALEDWQRALVGRQAGDLLRGLFHSDGSRFTNPVRKRLNAGVKHYAYPRYMFVNQSADIRKICTDALDLLGIEWRYNRANSISVAKRESVARLDEFVGPKS
jgi:Homeodomain-like domain-containing protein